MVIVCDSISYYSCISQGHMKFHRVTIFMYSYYVMIACSLKFEFQLLKLVAVVQMLLHSDTQCKIWISTAQLVANITTISHIPDTYLKHEDTQYTNQQHIYIITEDLFWSNLEFSHCLIYIVCKLRQQRNQNICTFFLLTIDLHLY